MSTPTLRIALVPGDRRAHMQCFPAGQDCTIEPGFVVEYWLYMAKLLNFAPRFVAANGYGDSDPAGTNTTLFGMLIHNVADVTGPEAMYNDVPLQYGLEVGPPFVFTPQMIFFNTEHRKQEVRSALPLDISTTLLLVFGLLICHAMHSAINWYTGKKHLNWVVSREMSRFSNALAWTFLNIYLSVFVSQLAIEFYDIPPSTVPFNSFPDLMELVNAGQWKLVFVANSFAEQQIGHRLGYTSVSQIEADQRLVRLDSYDELSKYIAGKKFQAYVDSAMVLDWWQVPCDITWIVDNFIPGMPTGFFYRREVSKKYRLNYTLTNLTYDIFKHWQNEYERKVPTRLCGEAVPTAIDALNLKQTSSIFLVLVCGLLASLAAFGIERQIQFGQYCTQSIKNLKKVPPKVPSEAVRIIQTRRSPRLITVKQKTTVEFVRYL